MIVRITISLLLLLAVAAGCGRGDELTRVELRDGTVVFGTTVQTRADAIVLRLGDGEVRTIPVGDVREVRAATAEELAARDGGRAADGDATSPDHDKAMSGGDAAAGGEDAARTADGSGSGGTADAGDGASTKGDTGAGDGFAIGPRDERVASDSPRDAASSDVRYTGALGPGEGGAPITLPQGTALKVTLETPLGSDTSGTEDAVRARVSQPLLVGGVEAIPAGAEVRGRVVDVKKAGRIRKDAWIVVRFDTVAVDGTPVRVQTSPVRWEIKGGKSNWLVAGAAAGVGAVVGAVTGGKGGAAKGAVIGGAAGTGYVVATEGKNIRVRAGAPLSLAFARQAQVRRAQR